MLFRAVEHREFSKFCKFEARYLKNGRSHKKSCSHSKSSNSGHIAVLKKMTEIYKPLNPIWPPAAILNPGFMHVIQDVYLVSF